MKEVILIGIITGLLGFIIDYSVRQWESVIGLLNKIKSLKQLLNIPVYATGGVLVYLITLIHLFENIDYLLLLMLIGGVICTAIEFAYGILYNKVLKLNIWDYITVIKIGKITIPLNIMGQIDFSHFIWWCLLTIPVFYIKNIIQWIVG